MANISISRIDHKPIEEQDVEYVERKGIGHPDSLIDGIVEKAAVELSKYYIDKTGLVLHHNIDKGLIVGGTSTAKYGSGEITSPIEVIIAGRATKEFKGIKIPVDDIVIKAAGDYLREHTRFLDLEKEVRIYSKVLKGSADLNGIFGRRKDVPLANDTSFGVGFAPLSETERLTLETEKLLNSKEYKEKMPAVGEDVKVMGVRVKDKISLTIAIAFVARFIRSAEEYKRAKDRVAHDVIEKAKKLTEKEIEVFVNYGDAEENDEVYITKSGLSCESGDDGQVGRGNRVNGLITPFRSMSLEAAAGKNPLNHVGKIYNVLAGEIASNAVNLYPNIKECTVSIVSQIGRPINDPKHLNIGMIVEDEKKFDITKKRVQEIAEDYLENIGYITNEIIEGKHAMF
ncbi:MAG: methionine adenosyltransferase [Candidatus Micrarchaeaceae archaeon]